MPDEVIFSPQYGHPEAETGSRTSSQSDQLTVDAGINAM